MINKDVPDWPDTPPATNGNGRDPLSGMPWYIKAVILIGVPGAIALALTWQSAFVLQQSVALNGVKLVTMQQELRVHDAAAAAHVNDSHEALEELNRVVLAMCMNAATNMAGRDRCAGMTK